MGGNVKRSEREEITFRAPNRSETCKKHSPIGVETQEPGVGVRQRKLLKLQVVGKKEGEKLGKEPRKHLKRPIYGGPTQGNHGEAG